MASTKEYRNFILKQLSEVPNITCRPMMGEFLLYSNGILFGGIYDNRLLIKIIPENKPYNMPKEIPYPNAKPMYLIEDSGNKEKLTKIINTTVKNLNKI